MATPPPTGVGAQRGCPIGPQRLLSASGGLYFWTHPCARIKHFLAEPNNSALTLLEEQKATRAGVAFLAIKENMGATGIVVSARQSRPVKTSQDHSVEAHLASALSFATCMGALEKQFLLTALRKVDDGHCTYRVCRREKNEIPGDEAGANNLDLNEVIASFTTLTRASSSTLKPPSLLIAPFSESVPQGLRPTRDYKRRSNPEERHVSDGGIDVENRHACQLSIVRAVCWRVHISHRIMDAACTGAHLILALRPESAEELTSIMPLRSRTREKFPSILRRRQQESHKPSSSGDCLSSHCVDTASTPPRTFVWRSSALFDHLAFRQEPRGGESLVILGTSSRLRQQRSTPRPTLSASRALIPKQTVKHALKTPALSLNKLHAKSLRSAEASQPIVFGIDKDCRIKLEVPKLRFLHPCFFSFDNLCYPIPVPVIPGHEILDLALLKHQELGLFDDKDPRIVEQASRSSAPLQLPKLAELFTLKSASLSFIFGGQDAFVRPGILGNVKNAIIQDTKLNPINARGAFEREPENSHALKLSTKASQAGPIITNEDRTHKSMISQRSRIDLRTRSLQEKRRSTLRTWHLLGAVLVAALICHSTEVLNTTTWNYESCDKRRRWASIPTILTRPRKFEYSFSSKIPQCCHIALIIFQDAGTRQRCALRGLLETQDMTPAASHINTRRPEDRFVHANTMRPALGSVCNVTTYCASISLGYGIIRIHDNTTAYWQKGCLHPSKLPALREIKEIHYQRTSSKLPKIGSVIFQSSTILSTVTENVCQRRSLRNRLIWDSNWKISIFVAEAPYIIRPSCTWVFDLPKIFNKQTLLNPAPLRLRCLLANLPLAPTHRKHDIPPPDMEFTFQPLFQILLENSTASSL
ncbi:uncharacterized protein BDR25DRAFT_396582 [Lindgomyces ingoldianus]|uniref:Uncharacterized protein n=1 Tax=Lindgomyces ingoldianus TaxID=673940 RepID=A0ACB6QCW4_9PLEO|nr:uncharacterized protein BDR25DRAFT_396582 [Lindgomyces ingoldianus]KAF2464700.1 hypothetical protein BDR25DRAFT_396582 [Lindgomyces ingoldianus]